MAALTGDETLRGGLCIDSISSHEINARPKLIDNFIHLSLHYFTF